MSNKNIKPEIPNDLKSHLAEIKKHFSDGTATLMVGAGFSQNAKVLNNAKLPPLWDELADIFKGKLYPKEDKNKITKNALQLAEEYKTINTPKKLNDLIKKEIDDKNLEPDTVHMNLLRLPWKDIFTTNYDTLLEKTAISLHKDITTINEIKNLAGSSSPRIVKLHGSFPNYTPFIITEEDYRCYPDNFAPFVNTVQQAFMEGGLCLLGFSASDPNFKSWIGWVRDKFKDSTPHIYLIGLFDLPEPERRVLESQYIIPIDLSNILPDLGVHKHKSALMEFINQLRINLDIELKHDKENENVTFSCDWPINSKYMSPLLPKSNDNEFIDVMNHFREQRLEYPQWQILPRKNRDTLWTYTNSWIFFIPRFEKLEDPNDLLFIFEIIWRQEKCLISVHSSAIKSIESVLNKYNPFDLSTTQLVKIKQYDDSMDKDLKDAWATLLFALLRFYREDMDTEKYNQWINIAKELQNIDTNYQNKYYYELSLYHFCSMQFNELEVSLKEWSECKPIPEWKIKLASIYAEIGEYVTAETLAKDSLIEIRQLLPKNKEKVSDYRYLSLEGICMLLLKIILDNNKMYNDVISTDNGEPKDNYLSIEQYKERLGVLERFNASPWQEIESFELALSNNCIQPQQNHTTTKTFDGTLTNTVSLSNNIPEHLLNSNQLVRFFENAGLPIRCGSYNIASKALRKSAGFLSDSSPFVSIITLMRTGADKKEYDVIFGRNKIARIPNKGIDELTLGYIENLSYLIKNAKIKDDVRINPDFYSQAAKALYEIISRLTVKCSPKTLQKIFDLGVLIYKSNHPSKWMLFQDIGRSFFQRLFSAMKSKMILKNIKTLIELPIIDNDFSERFYQDPMDYIDWESGFKITKSYKRDKEVSQLINSTLDAVLSDNKIIRKYACLRINKLLEINLLNKAEKKKFAKNLLAQKDKKYKLPTKAPFYNFAYLKILDSEKNINETVKNYYFEEKFTFLDNGNYSSNTRAPQYLQELNRVASVFNNDEYCINFNEDEIVFLFQKIKEIWDIDKILLEKDKEKMINSQFMPIDLVKMFSPLEFTLTYVIIPKINLSDKAITKNISGMIEEMIKSKIPCLSAQVANIKLDNTSIEHVTDRIHEGLLSSDKNEFNNAATALGVYLKYAKKKMLESPPAYLISLLVETVSLRKNNVFSFAVNELCLIITEELFAFKKTDLKGLYIALDFLDKETDPIAKKEYIEKEDRLEFRQYSARLAFKLFEYCNKKKWPLHKNLVLWEDICNGDELPEIRNEWHQ